MFGECHAHMFMDGNDYRKAVLQHQKGVDETVVHRRLRRYQDLGITYIRDGGDCFGVSQRAEQLAQEYGIRYRTPIFAIHRKGRYGNIVGHSYTTMEEYTDLVRQVRKAGGHFIKIMITGIMDFNKHEVITGEPVSPREVQQLIHIAHEEGFAVMVHANGSEAVKNAVICGADSIEHGNFIDEDCLNVMAESDTVWVPTLVTVRNLIGRGGFPEQILAEIWKRQQHNVKLAFQKGVNVALGSDAGAHGVKHGRGLLQEYQAFKDILGESPELELRLKAAEAEIRKRF